MQSSDLCMHGMFMECIWPSERADFEGLGRIHETNYVY